MKIPKWILHGLWFGFVAFTGSAFILPLVEGKEITFEGIWGKVLFWMCWGALFGFVMKKRAQQMSKQIDKD